MNLRLLKTASRDKKPVKIQSDTFACTWWDSAPSGGLFKGLEALDLEQQALRLPWRYTLYLRDLQAPMALGAERPTA